MLVDLATRNSNHQAFVSSANDLPDHWLRHCARKLGMLGSLRVTCNYIAASIILLGGRIDTSGCLVAQLAQQLSTVKTDPLICERLSLELLLCSAEGASCSSLWAGLLSISGS